MEPNSNIMNWDDMIETDGPEFNVLDEGDYTFTVTRMERGRHPGSGKIPPCNMATLTVRIDNEIGDAFARCNLYLYRGLEWKIASFFRCIGQKKPGEKIAMDWNHVIGARGRAHFKPSSYTRGGEERTRNDMVFFYDYEPSVAFTEVKNDDMPWATEKSDGR